jgi:hypothetical protein
MYTYQRPVHKIAINTIHLESTFSKHLLLSMILRNVPIKIYNLSLTNVIIVVIIIHSKLHILLKLSKMYGYLKKKT